MEANFNCVLSLSSSLRWELTLDACADQRHEPPPGPSVHNQPLLPQRPSDQPVLLTLPVCVITSGKSGDGDRKVLISVSLRYRDGPGNRWPNARAEQDTINKAIPGVITAPLFLKLTFHNFSLCTPLQRHHYSPAVRV